MFANSDSSNYWPNLRIIARRVAERSESSNKMIAGAIIPYLMMPTWQSVLPMSYQKDADCHNQSADWFRNDVVVTTAFCTVLVLSAKKHRINVQKPQVSYLRLCNKKRGEENEKDNLKLSTYIITSICEKNKWLNFKNV